MIEFKSQTDVLHEYIRIGNILYKTELNGDYKTGNKQTKNKIELFKFLEKNLELANTTLTLLFIEI